MQNLSTSSGGGFGGVSLAFGVMFTLMYYCMIAIVVYWIYRLSKDVSDIKNIIADLREHLTMTERLSQAAQRREEEL